jgi:KaiC/GvpD/RAD55 family RecA-like ATPase
MPHEGGTPRPVLGTKIIFISTDLTRAKAQEIWCDFGLSLPNLREVPFSLGRGGDGKEDAPLHLRVDLVSHQPIGLAPTESGSSGGPQMLYNYLSQPQTNLGANTVAFVDLTSNTAGDDWGFVGRVIASLGHPGPAQPKHLVIVDAVEGLETLVGDVDAFGEQTTRRSRVAQLLRAASKRCHLVFISEESEPGKSLPEQYVTDVVIRLRNRPFNRYLRRTFEVEKARGQQHARGEHFYTIRSGRGSSTGSRENCDDPRTANSYIQIFPSLHLISRRAMNTTVSEPVTPRAGLQRAGFGITYLDEMLGSTSSMDQSSWPHDERGLPYGSQTALIGDPGTY